LPAQKAGSGVLRSSILHFFKEFQMKKLALLFMALFCVSAFAQDLPKITVYISGNIRADEKRALETRMLASIFKSGRYRVVDRSEESTNKLATEHIKQRDGSVDEEQIKRLGKQYGVDFICIADITQVFNMFQVSVRILDVETMEVVFADNDSDQLRSMDGLPRALDKVWEKMFSNQTATAPKPEAAPAPAQPVAAESNLEHPAAKPEEPEPSTIPMTVVSRNYDRYLTLRYMPIASPVYWSLPAHNVETGWVWRNGVFFSFDLGVAYYFEDNKDGIVLGLGLNIGKSFELAHDFNLALGGSLGYWSWTDYYYDDNNQYGKDGFDWIGPFVQLRYRTFELSYRALFGTTEEVRNGNVQSSGSSGSSFNNQIGIGLHFEGSDRFGQPRNYDRYFALRYLPVTSLVYMSPIAYNIEYGWVLGNGMYMGIDFVLAAILDGNRGESGGGFNFGKSFELAPEFNLALGGSLGFWWWQDSYYDDSVYRDKTKTGFNWVGPFVRLRYSIFELSYRALFGRTVDDDEELSSDIGFSNQLGIGIYSESQKRRK
jgi:hypothetical protein